MDKKVARLMKHMLTILESQAEENCYKTTDPNLVKFQDSLKDARKHLTEYIYTQEGK